GLCLDLLHEAVPVALDAIEREAELRARHGVYRHERGMRETLVEILDDDARVIQDEVPIDQCRHAVIRVEIEEILRELRGVHAHYIDADAFFGQHDARAMTEWVIRRREQRHDGSSARQLPAPATSPPYQGPRLIEHTPALLALNSTRHAKPSLCHRFSN